MVSQVPYVAPSGIVYDIETYEIITIEKVMVKGVETDKENSTFIARVLIEGVEKYRTVAYTEEDAAWQDAFNWSRAKEKKSK